MKYLIFLFALFTTTQVFAQTSADAILGKWLKIPKEDLIILVYKKGAEFKGKILKEKEALKKQSVGFVILERLEYNQNKNVWTGGKIHDPNSGKTYDAEARIITEGELEVKCYLGMKFLGTKKYFRRVK